jgi:hypothetical protein
MEEERGVVSDEIVGINNCLERLYDAQETSEVRL